VRTDTASCGGARRSLTSGPDTADLPLGLCDPWICEPEPCVTSRRCDLVELALYLLDVWAPVVTRDFRLVRRSKKTLTVFGAHGTKTKQGLSIKAVVRQVVETPG